MRLFVHVEGQTEEEFVNEVLASELYKVGYTSVSARICGAARPRKRRGGICGWPTFRGEVARHLKSDGGAYATTLSITMHCQVEGRMVGPAGILVEDWRSTIKRSILRLP